MVCTFFIAFLHNSCNFQYLILGWSTLVLGPSIVQPTIKCLLCFLSDGHIILLNYLLLERNPAQVGALGDRILASRSCKQTYATESYSSQDKSQKKCFLNENMHMQGWNPQKPTKLDGNDTAILSTIHTSCANYALCQWFAQEGCGKWWGWQSWVCSACLCVWRLRYVVDSCNVVATEHGQDICRNCIVHEQCWVCIACQSSVSYVVKCCYCLTWQTWIVFYVEDCGESNAQCHVYLVGVDRVMYFQSIVGKMAQDLGMVESIVVSFPSSLVGF